MAFIATNTTAPSAPSSAGSSTHTFVTAQAKFGAVVTTPTKGLVWWPWGSS